MSLQTGKSFLLLFSKKKFCSFLKKSTKKLLSAWRARQARPGAP